MDSEHDVWEKRLHDPNATPMSLPLEFLKAITSDFSKELILGEGGFGVVYKGILRSGKIIAVKKLFEIHLKEETFQNEVRYLMGIKHQNVVRFVGYCAESSWVAMELPGGSGKVIFAEIPKRLLYFEYVYNKSLDNHISGMAIPPLIKIISVENRVHDNISSIDTNQIEPLIIVAGFSSGSVYLWNYDMQKMIHLIELHAGKVSSVRFVARKQWFLAGTHDGFVYVFNYERAQKITIFKAHNGYLYSLAVHPTQPYLLLACSSYQLKLWKGWFGWKCVQTFVGHLENVRRVAFNPENTNSFVSASDDHTIKVWNIHSPICNYTLRGHSGGVTSLDFFTRDGHQYLITGSNDRTAKTWDMQKKECVCTLEHHTSAVLSVVSHPNLPLLVTGTYGGLVYLWSSTDFRLIRIVSISGHYSIGGLACLIGSGRVVVAHNEGLSVIEIRDEEQVASKGNSGNSIYARQRQIRKSKAISATD